MCICVRVCVGCEGGRRAVGARGGVCRHPCDVHNVRIGVAVCCVLQLLPQRVSTAIAAWGGELIEYKDER